VHGAAEPFRDLVDESLDEATFLWRRWESELTSLTRNLDEIYSWTEDRLHGALDGVRAAGTALVDVATSGLLSDEMDRVTVSFALLAGSTDPPAVAAISTALGAADDERLGAMMRGLELLGSSQALRAAAAALAARGPTHAGALCRLKAFRRAALGDEVVSAFRSNNPTAQVDAARAARHGPSGPAEEWITAALRSDDARVRSAAVESGFARGMAVAWDAARRLAHLGNVAAGPYLKLVALLGEADDHEVVFDALRVPDLQLDAIWALGHIGTVRAAEACLAGMQHEKLARACGEAYCWITGADLARDRLAMAEPASEVPAFEDDDLEANLVPAPEALWPLPDADATRRHWVERRAQWAADVRHIRGRPASSDTLIAAVETGPMLRRPDLVLELRAKTRGRYDVETRAFAARQRQMMVVARAALAHAGGQ
jgi:uncharacterized protein (TIGR02270 family)